jgi:hypothetical protein
MQTKLKRNFMHTMLLATMVAASSLLMIRPALAAVGDAVMYYRGSDAQLIGPSTWVTVLSHHQQPRTSPLYVTASFDVVNPTSAASWATCELIADVTGQAQLQTITLPANVTTAMTMQLLVPLMSVNGGQGVNLICKSGLNSGVSVTSAVMIVTQANTAAYVQQ